MKLFKSFATVGGFTLMSRVLGFGREILIAALLGSGPVAEAFFVAFRFPNLFRRLFAEGAFNSAFIPLFAKRLEGEGPKEAQRFASEALSVLVFALIVVTALAEIFMPWAMLGMAGGFVKHQEKFDLAVLLTRITMPYLLFVSLLALYSGILNAFHKFAAAAAAPVLLNVVFIATLAVLLLLKVGNRPEAGIVMAWAVSIAGLLQLLVVMVAAKKIGMALRLRLPRLTPGVRRLLQLGVPGVLAGGIVQINIVIGTLIASMQNHAISWLNYADRLYQLPLGVIGIAIGVVLLPDISRLLRAGQEQAAMDSQNRSLEMSLLLTLPASVALAVVPEPLISVLFERGHFTAHDSEMVGLALLAFAFGLPAFVLTKVFQPGYFAREDTRAPMVYAGLSMLANVTISLALFPWLGHIGIAIATSVAGWLNTFLLWRGLAKRRHFALDAQARHALPRILFSSLLMGGALFLLLPYLAPWLDRGEPFFIRSGALGGLVVAGVVIYFFIAALVGAFSVRALVSRLGRRG